MNTTPLAELCNIAAECTTVGILQKMVLSKARDTSIAKVVLTPRRIGRDVMLLPVDEHHFSVSVKVEVSPQFFGWVCGLGKGVRIVSPAAVVEQMGKYVKEIANLY